MIEPPPRARIGGTTIWASQWLDNTFDAKTLSKAESGRSAIGPAHGLTAAFAIKTSTAPSSEIVRSTRACSWSLWPMWHGMGSAAPGRSRLMSSAAASHASGVRLDTTTRAPCSARRRAMARPMPRVDPVTTATLPVRSKSPPPARGSAPGRSTRIIVMDLDVDVSTLSQSWAGRLSGDPNGSRR